MTRILTGVKVRHAACGAILRRITASKGSKGERKADSKGSKAPTHTARGAQPRPL